MVDNTRTSQEGAVLVISLLMLAMISSIAFTVSSIVYRNVTVERAYDDAVTSYYAAETGVERALDIATKKRNASQTIASTESVIESFATSGSPASLGNSKTTYYVDSTTSGRGVSSLRQLVNQRAQVELYNPDSPFTYLSVESMRWLWNMPSTCPGTSRLEVSFYDFNSTSIGLSDDSVYKQVFSCGAETPSGGFDCQATSNYPSINTNYIVSVWSMDCSLIDLTTTAYSADNAASSIVSIPSIVQWSAVGIGATSQRQMTATTKWLPSASGLAQFVLFSVDAVAK